MFFPTPTLSSAMSPLLSITFHAYVLYCTYIKVVLWDKIIKRGENALLDYRSMNTKYYFWDDGNGLK